MSDLDSVLEAAGISSQEASVARAELADLRRKAAAFDAMQAARPAVIPISDAVAIARSAIGHDPASIRDSIVDALEAWR